MIQFVYLGRTCALQRSQKRVETSCYAKLKGHPVRKEFCVLNIEDRVSFTESISLFIFYYSPTPVSLGP